MTGKEGNSNYKERIFVIAAVVFLYFLLLSPIQIDLSNEAPPLAVSIIAVLIEGFVSAYSDTMLNRLVLKSWFMRAYRKKEDPELSNKMEQYKKRAHMSNSDIYNKASREMKQQMDEAKSRAITSGGVAFLFLLYPALFIILYLLQIPPTPFTQVRQVTALATLFLSPFLAYTFGRLALIYRHKYLDCQKSVIKEIGQEPTEQPKRVPKKSQPLRHGKRAGA